MWVHNVIYEKFSIKNFIYGVTQQKLSARNIFSHINVIMWHLNIHVGLLINASPWQPITKMCAYTFSRLSLCPFSILLYHISNALCQSIYSHCMPRKALLQIVQHCPCCAILMCTNVLYIRIRNKTGY